MITKEEIIDKVNGMLIDNEIQKSIVNRVEHLLKSGSIDLADYEEGSYILPKILLSAALSWEADQYAPSNKENIKTLKNLLII